VGLLIAVVLFMLLDVAAWRWAADSRKVEPRDRFWWPNG
jgi:hypothetical protein